MGDEDGDSPAVKKSKPVRFGTLAEHKAIERIKDMVAKEEARVAATTDHTPSTSEESSAKKETTSNINVSNEHYDLDKIVDPHKEMMLAEFERRRRARQLTLPTDDNEVKQMLRRLDQPICIFGEDKPDRRERLRLLLSDKEEDEVQKILHREEPVTYRPKEDDNSTWYHEGPDSLRQARLFIAEYSLPRAKRRLEIAREKKNLSAQERAMKLQETHKWVRVMAMYGSQIGDNRPISYCEFSPNSGYIATASWSGLCKLWSLPDLKLLRTFRGHNTNAGCIRFHPDSTVSADPGALNLASCSHDGSIFLWSLDSDEPIADLEGHAPYRVSRLAFHPSGRFLATCCHDKSWRLFDLEVNEEVLFQEGHSKEVFDIDFQNDGSLSLTGGMDGYGRVWDLRTGRCIMFLEGHQNHVLTVNFSPNGYQMATGGADNTCRIWDLRMRRCIYTIPAHKSLVSKLKCESSFLVTGSYDNTIKMWTYPGWQQIKQLQGHDSKVMCVDVSSDGKWLASSSFDRTVKLWAPEPTS